MIVKYKYGFDFDGVLYGWSDKKLYRLPQMIGKSFYPIKEIPLITQKRKSGLFKGYRLYGNKRKSVNQLKELTHYINFEHEVIKDKDCPF